MITLNGIAAEADDDTWFERALRWRVHDSGEALHIAATHRRHADELRARGPGWEHHACRHDEMAGLAEARAAALDAVEAEDGQ